MCHSERDSDPEPRSGTHPVPVKVLLDLDVLHQAVLGQGQSQKAEGHSVAQHARLAWGEKKEPLKKPSWESSRGMETEGERERGTNPPRPLV